MPSVENYVLYNNWCIRHRAASVDSLSQLHSQEIFRLNVPLHFKFLGSFVIKVDILGHNVLHSCDIPDDNILHIHLCENLNVISV
jgi:hypothetical protein